MACIDDFNDRLVLGLQGTMSEAELHLIRHRLTAGLRHKAAQGNLRQGLPVGFVHDEEGAIVLDPDESVRAAIATVFHRFDELGSGRQVMLSLTTRDQKPLRPHRGAKEHTADPPGAKGDPSLLPDGELIYVFLDNLNHHHGQMIRDWYADRVVELVFTPTSGSWANPIEAHFGLLHQFTVANSDYADHAELVKAIRDHIRWRNANTKDPDILALERKYRANLHDRTQRRCGQPRARAA